MNKSYTVLDRFIPLNKEQRQVKQDILELLEKKDRIIASLRCRVAKAQHQITPTCRHDMGG